MADVSQKKIVEDLHDTQTCLVEVSTSVTQTLSANAPPWMTAILEEFSRDRSDAKRMRELLTASPAASQDELLELLLSQEFTAYLKNFADQPQVLRKVLETCQQSLAPQRHGHWIGRFELKELLAAGGQGEVWKAVDSELHREVALKIIRSGHRDFKLARRRFEHEAWVTGKLEHPGIVPIYEAGQSSFRPGATIDSPFYVMRLYPNQSLQKHIEEFHSKSWSASTLRELLRCFIAVCNAVGYAHSRSVIHRDLKPQNIMLGAFGETLVVDWGLAKVMDSEDPSKETDDILTVPQEYQAEETEAGALVGTPAYMSPEQARREVASLGTPTDIYGLGAILYRILTGHSPVDSCGNRDEVLDRVRRGAIQPPHIVNPRIPRALSAVCMKALSLNPEDRYTKPEVTAEQGELTLANDVTRWLNDEKVKVFQDPWSVEVSRWARTHRTLVGSVFAALSVGTITLAVMLAFVSAARERAVQNETRAIVGETLATKNAEIAEQQSHLALDTLKGVIFDLQDSLSYVAGGPAVRRQLLIGILPKLQQVSSDFGARSTIDRNTMTVLSELGDVVLQLGEETSSQSAFSVSNSSQKTDTNGWQPALTTARGFYERSFEIASQLAANVANDVTASDAARAEANSDVAMALEKLGHLSVIEGNLIKAREQLTESYRLRQNLAETNPSNAAWQHDLSVALERLGSLSVLQGDLSEAERLFLESLRVCEKLLDLPGANSKWRHDRLSSYSKLGDIATDRGDLPAAQSFHEQTYALAQELFQSDRSNTIWQHALSVACERLGDLLALQGNVVRAESLYSESLDIAKQLVTFDPRHTESRRGLAVSLSKLATLAANQGNLEDAERLFSECRDNLEKLAGADPENLLHRRDLAISLSKLSKIAEQRGDLAEAERLANQLHTLRLQLIDIDSTNVEWQRDLAISFETLGDLALIRGDLDRVVQCFEESCKIWSHLITLDETNGDWQHGLTVPLVRLGLLALEQNKPDEAAPHLSKALRVARELHEMAPDHAEWKHNLSVVLVNFGDLERALKHVAKSQNAYAEAIDVERALLSNDSTNIAWWRHLEVALNKAGDVALGSGSFLEARLLLDEARSIAKDLALNAPDILEFQQDLVTVRSLLAELSEKEQNFVTATEHYQDALAVVDQLIKDGHDSEQLADWKNELQSRIEMCGRNRIAIGDWDTLLEQPGQELPLLLAMRCSSLARKKRTPDVIQAAEKLEELAEKAAPGASFERKGFMHCAAASGYALCAQITAGWDGVSRFSRSSLDQLNAEQKAEFDRFAALAISALKAGMEGGFDDPNRLATEEDLAAISGLPEFRRVLGVDDQ